MSAAPNDPTMRRAGEDRESLLGLVTVRTVAGGNGGGPTHARLGIYAKWTCDGCTSTQFTGRYPCKECCGYTTSNAKVVRGVMGLKGKPNARCPR